MPSSRQPRFRESQKREEMAGAEVGISKSQTFHFVYNSRNTVTTTGLGEKTYVWCCCLMKPTKSSQLQHTTKTYAYFLVWIDPFQHRKDFDKLLPPAFMNKILLYVNHTHLPTCYLWFMFVYRVVARDPLIDPEEQNSMSAQY